MKKSKTCEGGKPAARLLKTLFPGGWQAAPTEIFSFIISLCLASALALHGYFVSVKPNLWLLTFAIAVLTPAIYFLQELFAEKYPCFGPAGLRKQRDRLSWKIFAAVAGVTFLAMLFALAAHYPGAANWDNMEQWGQVQTGTFDDWHPAIHSMLIWLVTRIVNKYAFVIAVQMLCFSLLAGYMAATLRAWGLKRAWVAAFAVSLLSARSTQGILLYAIKDTAFMLLALALTVQTIDIVLSDAAWLRKWPNRIAFALAVALASLVRHNGIFITIPLLSLLLLLYRKKSLWECVISALLALMVFLGVRGPLYRFTRVAPNAYAGHVEAIGLPMTILCSVYRTEPDRLAPETIALMQALAPEELWAEYFVFGSYNSVKWRADANGKLKDVPLGDLLRMTLQCMRAAPETSLRAALALTREVWDPTVTDQTVSPMIAWDHPNDHPNSIVSQIAATDPAKVEAFAKPYGAYRDFVQMLTPSQLLQSAGINLFALALAGAYSLRRRRGLHTLLLILPSAAYNIGTMLMLCGGDYRFFQFNAVITIPLVLVCLARESQVKSEPRERSEQGG